MEPISTIVIALATGAVAAAKPTAEQAVKDAYTAIKTLIQRKYGSVDLTHIEKKPESAARQNVLAEDLKEAGADQDQEVLERVNALLDAVEQHDRAAAAAVGIDIEEVKAAHLTAQKVIAEGVGVRVRKSEFSGGIDLGEVQAGKVDHPENP